MSSRFRHLPFFLLIQAQGAFTETEAVFETFGIHNVLCLTGDHQRFGDHPSSVNVFDMDSYVIPVFAQLFRDAGTSLPTLTLVIIHPMRRNFPVCWVNG